MEDAKSRVKAEQLDLQDKIEKLGRFLVSERYYSLSEEHRFLLSQQYGIMMEYSRVLSRRLVIWDK